MAEDREERGEARNLLSYSVALALARQQQRYMAAISAGNAFEVMARSAKWLFSLPPASLHLRNMPF